MEADTSFVSQIDKTLSYREFIKEFERQCIMQALDKFQWNLTKASEWLDLNRTTLVMRAKSLGIVKGAKKI